MDRTFEQLFSRRPDRDENGIFYFDAGNDGDFFTESDIDYWRTTGFRESLSRRTFWENPASRHLISAAGQADSPVIELACGPGMGLLPSIKRENPLLPCMATDANALVLQEWKQYLENNKTYEQLSFAQFSAFDIPLKSGSVPAYSSFIGLSSTRRGEDGYRLALSEVRRTLSPEGLLYAIENEWTDIPAILGLFEKMNQKPWTIFCEKQSSWHDRFLESGFEIISEQPYDYRSLRADDNELGKAASTFGVDVGLKFTAYLVKKR